MAEDQKSYSNSIPNISPQNMYRNQNCAKVSHKPKPAGGRPLVL